MSLSKNTHLTSSEMIKKGSFFTPEHISSLVFNYVKPILKDDDVIVDFGAGYGAFELAFQSVTNQIITTDIDETSLIELKKTFPSIHTIFENSLINIDRKKYCTENQNLISIGNPPYNDTTSIYKKGEKGENHCDPVLKARDLGISFLKLYAELQSAYVCVLHPLAYLIKKSNFKSLGQFKDNYKLTKATIFSSLEFESIKKGNSAFPVVAAFYERTENGMDFDYISNFSFDILNSSSKFRLNDYDTIDGKIPKYPDKENYYYEGLQFYTLRDINALKRNATFIDGFCANGIKVTLENLYQYAWLEYFKATFNPVENGYIFGNLSPLYDKAIETTEKKKELIRYVWDNKPIIQKYFTYETLSEYYGDF